MVLYFCYLFSYPSLLELHYGGRLRKSQTTREQAREAGLSIQEAKCQIDTELFLNKYPQWELGTPHWSVILHKMFLHATKWGQKEAERLVCWGCQGSMWRPNLEVDQSTLELVGYWTSQKEIWDIYHSVYLLRRSPGLPPCGSQWRRKAIHDILSSLKGQLHQQVYPTAAGETSGLMDECWSRPIRRDSYEVTLWEIRAAHQRVLETAKVLRSDIERLSWGVREATQTHSWSHSRRCSGSHNRSHLQGCSLDRLPRSPSRSWLGRRVTFREPEVELGPVGGGEDYPSEPSILDVKLWLDWQAWQIGMPCEWRELRAIPGVEDPLKLAWKIWASFLIPKIGGKVFLGQDYTPPPAPQCLTWNAFLPNELSYQDVWQQLFFLTIAYTRGLQHWAEKLNLPENPDFHLLVRSVIQLRKMVEEQIMFTDWDIFWDLERVDPEAMSQWPQPSLSHLGRMEPPLDNQPGKKNICFMETATQTASLAMTDVELTRHITPPDRTE